MKKFSSACERNQSHILGVLSSVFDEPGSVLEIGSGTGQHAVYFASRMPHLEWYPSDLPENLSSVEAWRNEAGLGNLHEPRLIDLAAPAMLSRPVRYIVCINTIHIVPWNLVGALFEFAGRSLEDDGLLFCYGPYRYSGRPLEPSNEHFDAALRARGVGSGIRLFEDVDRVARANGMILQGDRAMPANNRSIWWRRVGTGKG